MKKLFPIVIFIMAFFGFLSSQIIWDTFNLNAEQVKEDKQKYSLYESNFHTLKFTTLENESVELKNVSEPIIVLNFWASWCRPCLEEFPSLVEFQEKFRGKVAVFGINGDEENPRDNALKAQKKYKLNFPSTLDSQGRIGEKFLINTYPVSIVFHQGKVIYVSKKLHNFMDESFVKMIESHLK
ncbi:MAG: TlpA disulfide reductase family protein [Bacteriovoracaceae bacterium]